MVHTWYFQCSACGKCCDSAPLMSLPELLHHQHRFIGCLGIRRMLRPQTGEWLDAGAARMTVADVEAFQVNSQACLHQVTHVESGRSGAEAQGSTLLDEDFLLTTLAFDDPSAMRCPALESDGTCMVQTNRKPAACRVVPFDALLPDRLQHIVLAARRGQAVGASVACIAPEKRSGFVPMAEGGLLLNDQYKRALNERRHALAQEKFFWSDAVFRSLQAELFAHSERVARIPTRGLLVMSIAPALMELAQASEQCCVRIGEYLDAQIDLGESTIQSGVANEPAPTRARNELAAFTQTNRRLRAALNARSRFGLTRTRSPSEQAAVEAWLELTPHESPEGVQDARICTCSTQQK